MFAIPQCRREWSLMDHLALARQKAMSPAAHPGLTKYPAKTDQKRSSLMGD